MVHEEMKEVRRMGRERRESPVVDLFDQLSCHIFELSYLFEIHDHEDLDGAQRYEAKWISRIQKELRVGSSAHFFWKTVPSCDDCIGKQAACDVQSVLKALVSSEVSIARVSPGHLWVVHFISIEIFYT
ncbi:hypothetical protein ElyMa_006477000 [Elysia marginata]|uniref:Uncharacterized protein n=1 Tax=Elysia marginata TaxID=1093978 RepID=A0AAV4I128_9GAST|nr:hypothetical protein ElyMa_006477000 [Elysia marginata]